MRYQLAFAALPALTLAFPGLGYKEDYVKAALKQREAFPEADPGLVGDVVDSLTSVVDDIAALTASVASSVDPSDARPQAGYEFIAPTASDSRGPCPGLNLLANYGYLPRNGYVTASQVIAATAEGFNMGADLATVLVVFAVLTDGDISTESWWLGAPPSGVGGLNRHSTVEADVSILREDYYLGCGNGHAVSSRLAKQLVGFAAASDDKDFGLATLTAQYDAQSTFSKTYNPYIYYFPFPAIVSFVAFAFYPNFFSNGTYGAGGVANYESISSIVGFQLDETTGNFEYVPERWPENWYRRSSEYGALAGLTEGLAIYATNPVLMPFGQLGTDNLNASTILCDIYQGIESIVPLFFSGTAEETAAAATWALDLLEPALGDTISGCPTDTLSSNFLFPDTTKDGSALQPPPAVASNAGNNVYNQVYFTAAPTVPQCSPTATL